jgi:lipoprotein-anchoring transpeptidase ErfK/SrfK
MPNWMRLTGYGIGMHAGIIPNPGSPASHGCIRLPQYMSERLFENAVEGTPVTIVQ